MDSDNNNYKLLIAAGFGLLGGLLLSKYLRETAACGQKPLSKQVAALSKVLEELEDLNTGEAANLEQKINNILNTLDSTYGNHKRKL